MATIQLKTGDTFEYTGYFKTAAGVAVDMTGWTARAQIRTHSAKALVAELTTTWLDIDAGILHIVAPESTAAWPCATLVMDVELTDADDRVTSTDTVLILVVEDVTK